MPNEQDGAKISQAYREHRPYLVDLAFRMLGDIGAAEDVVQDAWLRRQGADRSDVRDAGAFLATTTTRLALNAVQSARARRETYIGPWLPEPVDTSADPALAALRAGDDVLLITDAGMPGVSDPGYRLVAAAAAAGVRVTVLPGPSAVTAALAVSGLPSDRFCFEGFPPRRAGDRARRFAELAAERRTLVFFESPRRLAATLAELAAAFGQDRQGVVCRELTKTHEETRRGTLGELADWAAGGTLGEVTLVIAGAPAGTGAGPGHGGAAGEVSPDAAAGLAAEVAAREAAGTPRKQAIAAVAREHGLQKRVVYDAVLAARQRLGSR